MTKRPAFQFYPADWRKDAQLQSCSIGARGLWHELLCVMHECEPYGCLVLNGEPMPEAKASRLVGVTPTEYRRLLAEIESAGVSSRDDHGALYSRRMVKDEAIRNARAEGGKAGAEFGRLGAEHGKKGGRPRTSNVADEAGSKPPSKPAPSSSSSVLGISDSSNASTSVASVSSPSQTSSASASKPTQHRNPLPTAARPAAEETPLTRETWNAYSTAYERRYCVQPKGNRRVNAMLKQVVERIGRDEAPNVAAFYLTSRKGLYVASKHCVDLLLRDCETLRTEWATNSPGTETEARQSDRTAALGNAFAPLIAEAEAEERAHRNGAER